MQTFALCRPHTCHFHCSIIGGLRSTHYFLIIALEHRLCVFVILDGAVLTCTQNLCFRAIIRKISKSFKRNLLFSAADKQTPYIERLISYC